MKNKLLTKYPFIAFAIFLGIIASINIGKISITLPFFIENLSFIDIGLYLSIFSISSVLLSLIIGNFINKNNVFIFIFIASICLFLGGYLGSLSKNLIHFLLARIIEGIGFTLIITSCPFLISISTNLENKKRFMTLWGSALPLGITLGLILFFPFYETENWNLYWQIISFISLPFAIISLLLIYNNPFKNSNQEIKKFYIKDVIKNKGILFLSIVFFLINMQNLAIVAWIGKIIIEYLGLEGNYVTLLSGSIIFMNVLANILVFIYFKYIKLVPLILTAQIGIVITISSFFILDTIVLKLISLYMFSFFTGMVPGLLMGNVDYFEKRESHVPQSVSFLVFGDNLGALMGPSVFAILLSLTNVWEGFIIVPIFALTVIFILIKIMKI